MTPPKKPAARPPAKRAAGATQKVTRRRAHTWKPKFLAALVAERTVTAAAQAAGVSRKTVYLARDTDADFAAAWEVVDQAINDEIRSEIARRAIDGWEEPVYYKGDQVGRVRRFSDQLLMFLARSKMPEFRERTEITGAGGGPIAILALSELARETGVAGELEDGKS